MRLWFCTLLTTMVTAYYHKWIHWMDLFSMLRALCSCSWTSLGVVLTEDDLKDSSVRNVNSAERSPKEAGLVATWSHHMYFQIIWGNKEQNRPSLCTENFKCVRVIRYIWLSWTSGNLLKRVLPHFKRWLKMFRSAYLSSLWDGCLLTFQRLLKPKGFYHRDLFILCIHTFTSLYILYRKTKESSWKRCSVVYFLQLSAAILVVFLGKKKSILMCLTVNLLIK